MATEVIKPPLPLFSDDSGNELENGYIYIGEAGLDPENNPVSVYWDRAQTIPAAQPLRTVSGYVSYNGSPSRVFIGQSYSITVKDKKEQVVYTSLNDNFLSEFNLDASQITYGDSTVEEALDDLTSESQTYSIPTDFADMQTAVEEISRLNNSASDITINIETGHKLTGGLYLSGGSYSNIKITSTDAVVSLDASFSGVVSNEPVFVTGTFPADTLFYFYNCEAPTIQCKIDMGGLYGEGAFYVNSRGVILCPNGTSGESGIINAGNRGLNARNSQVWAGLCDFSGAQSTGIRAQLATTLNVGGALANDCCVSAGQDDGAVYASRASNVEFRFGEAKNSGGKGVVCRRSKISAGDVDATGCADTQFEASTCGEIDATASISGGSTAQPVYFSEFGGKITAVAATVTSPANSANVFGMKTGGEISVLDSTTVDAVAIAKGNVRPSPLDISFDFNLPSGQGIVYNADSTPLLQQVGDSTWNVHRFSDGRVSAWTKVPVVTNTGTIAAGAYTGTLTLPSLPTTVDTVENYVINVAGHQNTDAGGSRLLVNSSVGTNYSNNELKVYNTGQLLASAGSGVAMESVSLHIQLWGTWS